jgi:hypothetical protein
MNGCCELGGNSNVTGNLRQQSQRVSWSLNKTQFVRFRADLCELLQPYGSLTVQLPGGEQQWQFVRLENSSGPDKIKPMARNVRAMGKCCDDSTELRT